jgi:AcrR family transcriptional regulator
VLATLTPAEPPDSPQGRKRRRLIEAATELFLRHGYRKTSVEDVAQRAGVAKGTVYLYFKNKADLLVHALIEEKRQHLQGIRAFFAPGLEPRARLRAWLRFVVERAPAMPLTAKLVSGDREIVQVLEEIDPDLERFANDLKIDFLSHAIAEICAPLQLASEELRDRARVLLGVYNSAGFFLDGRLRFGLSLERFAALLADMLVDGVASPLPEAQQVALGVKS